MTLLTLLAILMLRFIAGLKDEDSRYLIVEGWGIKE
jgi:hypothetical protein